MQKNKYKNTRCVFAIFMRWMYIIFSLVLLPDIVGASPHIIDWSNNITGDNSSEIAILTGDTISFNVSANETVNWTWTLDGEDQDNDQDNWVYTFPSYGTYHVSVSGSNVNGSTQTVNWTVTSTLKFTDALGNNISITKKPERIVSLAPSNTEILFALGLGDRVVGVTSYCDYPPEAMSKEKVGGFYNPSVELVVNLTPDLILSSSGNDINVVNQLIEECETLNCTVVGLEAKTVDEIIENIKLVGKIADVNAGNLALEITQRINAVESNTSGLPEDQKPKVFYAIWYDPLYTGGNGTFADDLIQKAGGKNIASDFDGWYKISREDVLSSNPEVIVCSGMGGSGADVCNNIKNDAALKSVDAVVNNSLYVIGDPNIIERPGPRIASGLETIYALLNFPQGEVNATPVQITSPQSTSYEHGSTITVSYTSSASISTSFYSLDDGFVTSFDNEAATISPGSGSHSITIWVRDAGGDWGSDTLSFTVKSPPQQSYGGGGESSSPPEITVTTSAGKAVVSIPHIGAGSTVSVQIPDAQDVDVTGISIKAKRSVNSAKIAIKSLDSHPSDALTLDGVPYRYLEIKKQNIEEEDIDDLIIKFKVKRTWIADNEVDQKTIKLERYDNGQWNGLPTSKSKEDPTYLYYTANSPGLSYFAITGEKLVPPPAPSSPVETSPPATEPPTTTPKPTVSSTAMPTARPTIPPTPGEASKEKGICGPTAVALIVLLPMILHILLRRRKL